MEHLMGLMRVERGPSLTIVLKLNFRKVAWHCDSKMSGLETIYLSGLDGGS